MKSGREAQLKTNSIFSHLQKSEKPLLRIAKPSAEGVTIKR